MDDFLKTDFMLLSKKTSPPIEYEALDQKYLQTRDFLRYDCMERVRIGGLANYVKSTSDKLWRIDGAWFICLDKQVKPKKNDCAVLSFGISGDSTFDVAMQQIYGCRVESFDPFAEAEEFKLKRNSDESLKNAMSLNINDKWNFHRIGLVGAEDQVKNTNAIGAMMRMPDILALTKMSNQIIDVVKMDIEGGEWSVVLNLDMEYACRHFKQMLIETHTMDVPGVKEAPRANMRLGFKVLARLEKCFLMYHRHTRFAVCDQWGATGHISDYQNPKGCLINIKEYGDETDLAAFMFAHGELYFLNKNFL